jgi:hypothetical protein
MAKLSKNNEYAIKYLINQGHNVEHIVKELGVTKSQVEKIITTTQTKTTPAKTDKTKDLMIRQTSAKKINSVSIMTESASQLGDEFIKNINTNGRNTEGYIFRPKN